MCSKLIIIVAMLCTHRLASSMHDLPEAWGKIENLTRFLLGSKTLGSYQLIRSMIQRSSLTESDTIEELKIIDNDTSNPSQHTFIWKVCNFSDLQSSEFIFSPRFYLHESGYRLQMLLVPNTTYSDNVSYLGVFFRIVAGDHDASLEWPYKYRTQLSLLQPEQYSLLKNNSSISKPLIGWKHTIMPNIDECRLRSAFLRPNSDIEIGANTDGCGSRRAIALNQLGEYLQEEDTLLVMLTVSKQTDRDESSMTLPKATMDMRYNEMVSNYFWDIDHFELKRNETMESNKITVFTSSPFYTHPSGYLMQLFLTILPKRNAFAVSMAFVQGDHDRYLQWPFPYPFEMAIVDKSPDYWKRDLTVKVKPSKSDCGTESFAQPSPSPEFCFLTIQSLQVLSLPHYNFLINDTLRIRFTTRFERYSSRQRSSIVLDNGRLTSQFNWIIPGVVTRFERYLKEGVLSAPSIKNESRAEDARSSGVKRQHKFISDEFYTNGQGYLCQLVLTVAIKSTFLGKEENIENKQDMLVFGLELVIIESEYDRFLDWPFAKHYELSIVGYKDGYNKPSEPSMNDNNSNQQLYTLVESKLKLNNSQESYLTNTKTSSKLVVPQAEVESGSCAKEAFQKPIERNPPCGVKNFIHFDVSKRESKNNDDNNTLNATSFADILDVGTLTKSDEDLHLRVKIFL